MSRNDTYRSRSLLAAAIEKKFRERDEWASCDAGRIGGKAWSEMPSYSNLSDAELIQKYLDEERQKEFWAGDTR